MNDVDIEVNLVALFRAAGHEARLTAAILSLLGVAGYPEVDCTVLGMSGEHIQGYRKQFREALGIAQSEVAYGQEESKAC